MNDQWLTVAQVAAEYDTTKPTVLAWIESGDLRAENHARKRGGNRRLRIHRDALAEFSASRSTHPKPAPAGRRRPTRHALLVNAFSPE